MKKFFTLLTFCCLLFSINHINAQTQIYPSDLKILAGEKWVGKLTYLDYSSNKKTSILSDLIIEPTTDSLIWIFKNIYPKEPKANSESKSKISRKGKIFDGEKVIERTQSNADELKIVTTKLKDKKQYRYTYLISKDKFSIRKEEKGASDKDFFERNTYEYSRTFK